MGIVILLYFVYTSTTREVISMFSCRQVDDPTRLPPEAWGGVEVNSSSNSYQEAVFALRYKSTNWIHGVWTSDTSVQCSSSSHIGLMVGLGIPGLVFALGFPLGMWVLLGRIGKQEADGHRRLEDPEVCTNE